MPARLALAALLLALLLPACGGGSEAPPAPPESPGDPEPPALDGAVVWSDLGCGDCHGADGTGGLGPDLSCTSADGLGAGHADLTGEQAAALETFLAEGGCEPGGGGGGGACTSCHAVPQSDRRAVVGEFSLASHHVADCVICHDQSAHMQGSVRLKNANDASEVYVVTSDLSTLEPFCLACHEDHAAWETGAHGSLTCLGDGSTFGCHGNGHGTANPALLTAEYVIADPNTRAAGDYQACWACHSSNTILFEDDAFGELHKKHVVEKDTACAACHNPHAPYDAGERGLIDLSRAWDAGWLTLPTGTTLSSAYTTSASSWTCTLRCHGETHD